MSSLTVPMKVLKEYPRAVVHLRRQLENKRFGLVLGAGVSKELNIPIWKELVERIANDSNIQGQELIHGNSESATFPYKTELLFQHYRKKELSKKSVTEPTLDAENEIYAAWLSICARHIYEKSPPNFEQALDNHAYMARLIPLIQDSQITVNFNFDDFVERALTLKKKLKDKGNRGFEIVTNPWPQFRRQDCVIYHPHGYFPEGIMELPTDRFVFSEAGYANKYVAHDGVDSSFLLIHFARHTCLIIGCSLEDSLRTVLLRGAHINPGNYHYHIHFLKKDDELSELEKTAISDTNFNVYNLITLFLTNEEIDAFLQLISPNTTSLHQLSDLSKRSGTDLDYFYYLTGPLGVGKSTTTSLLRNLFVLDEWLEKRLDILGKPWDTLTPDEREIADKWIIQQFGAKNDTLRGEAGKGAIAIVDRPPLDPLAFTDLPDYPAKATALLNSLCPDRAWNVVDGVIILLIGNCKELSTRLKASGRNEYTESKLSSMQVRLSTIYKGKGVKTIDTQGLSVIEVTKRVAQVIHREKYEPFDLTNALKTIAKE